MSSRKWRLCRCVRWQRASENIQRQSLTDDKIRLGVARTKNYTRTSALCVNKNNTFNFQAIPFRFSRLGRWERGFILFVRKRRSGVVRPKRRFKITNVRTIDYVVITLPKFEMFYVGPSKRICRATRVETVTYRMIKTKTSTRMINELSSCDKGFIILYSI